MEALGLGHYGSINEFVEAKLKRLDASPEGFSSLFELMFSEKENLMYEKSEGYRIQKTTYGQAYDEILRLAAGLNELLALPKGAAVGLSMDNSLRWIELFWAILICGWRPLLMNLRLSEAALEQALGDCGAQAVISDRRRYSVNTVLADDIPVADAPFSPDAFGEEILVMSSGTSDHVKVCAYSAEELRFQIHDSYGIIRECALVKRHCEGYIKQLCFLPFYHVFGLIAMYIWFAFFSRAFVQLNDMQPQTIVNTIKRHKVTHIFAVPLFWETVYDQAVKTIKNRGEKTYKKFQKGLRISRRLSGMPKLADAFSKAAFREVRENLFGDSISFLITGGSAIRPEVIEFFNAVGYRLADGYGMTEIGITSVELSDDRRVLNACSVGRPMTYAEYRINDKGELLVRGKSIAKYIIEDGKKTVTDKNEWFNTHDLAECVNGKYRILGRSDDLIVASNGENLNPNLAEPALRGGSNGVCLVSDGKTPVLLVSVNRYITAERLESLDREIKRLLGEQQLTGQVGRIVYISDPLMTGDEFKLNRKRLGEDYRSGRLHTVDPKKRETGGEEDELMRHLREVFAVALERRTEEVAPESDFFADLGGTSLDYFAMIAKLQEDFSLSFPQEAGSLNTARQFYDYIRNAQNDTD